MKMELLQGRRRAVNRPVSPGSNTVRETPQWSLAGWLLGTWSTLRANYRRSQLRGQHFNRIRPARQMQVVEWISLGGRRQLALVRCGDERFLVGCGSDQVHSILRVAAGEPETTAPMKDA